MNGKDNFIGYRLPRWSEKVNHLSYADDTILFYSANRKSVRMMMDVLRSYEKVSGQLTNLDKSLFYLHDKVPSVVGQKLRRLTGIGQGSFPFTYLGCSIFYGRKKKEYFEVHIGHGKVRYYQQGEVHIGQTCVTIPTNVSIVCGEPPKRCN